MTDLTIAIGQNFPLSFEGYLFNEPEQIKNQPCPFYVFHLTDKIKSFARFILFVDYNEAKSPYRAPFGSIEFDPVLTVEQLTDFIKAIDQFCIDNKLKSLSIVSYPYCYANSNSIMLTQILEKHGFKIVITDINFHLDVTSLDYEKMLHESERRRLKKCINQKFDLNIEPNPNLEEMYELIKLNRESKGHPVSIKLDQLEELFRKFTEKYIVFTLRDRGTLIASSIGVRVNSKILYYFLPSDHLMYKNYSPMVMLIKGIYDYCKENKYKILDLGISTDKGVPNEGLIRFKENLGAKKSLKLSFKKEFY